MEILWNEPSASPDALPRPDGLDRYAVLRALDRERLEEAAPDLPRERLSRLARIRDELRRGSYDRDDRLTFALHKALRDAARHGGRIA